MDRKVNYAWALRKKHKFIPMEIPCSGGDGHEEKAGNRQTEDAIYRLSVFFAGDGRGSGNGELLAVGGAKQSFPVSAAGGRETTNTVFWSLFLEIFEIWSVDLARRMDANGNILLGSSFSVS